MRARILKDDPIGRCHKGEIGIVLKNDFDKYDYFLEIEKVSDHGNIIPIYMYFYKDEVEVIE